MMNANPHTPVAPTHNERPSVPSVLRRWIVAVLLFILICLAANGIAGLIGALFDIEPVLEYNTYGLALWLAYALIGGPLAVLLWWWLWRGLRDEDRHSLAWGLYLAAMYTTSLIVFSVNLLSMFDALTHGNWEGDSAASAVVWFVVWFLHSRMLHNSAKSPTRLAPLPRALGVAFGLGLMAFNGGRALQVLLDTAVSETIVGYWGNWLLGALIWAVGGLVVWWWHWYREGVRQDDSGIADSTVLLVGILAPAGVAIGGGIALLSIGLRALLDNSAPASELLDELGLSVSALLVGTVVWLYHRRNVIERGEHMRKAMGLVESGLGLIALASGFGVVLNAALASFASSLTGHGATGLLLSGLAALVIGLVVWLWSWRPLQVAENYGDLARRVYLVIIFGVSAVVALVTLMVIAFRIFEFVLDSTGGVLERVRAPLGLLVATAFVAAYHFMVWRRDRQAVPASVPVPPAIRHVTLVIAPEATGLAEELRQHTSANVVVWARADAAPAPSAETLLQALQGVEGDHVLVLAGERIEIIPLAS